PPHRRGERPHERFPVVHVAGRIVPRVLVLAAGGGPCGGVTDVRPQRDAVVLGEIRESIQPLEIVRAARRLVVVPPETASPGGDPELVEEGEVLFHFRQRFVLVVVLEDAEGQPAAGRWLGRGQGGEPAEEQRDHEDGRPHLPAPHVESTCELRATPRCCGQTADRR